jgi:hypothetical protein
MDHGANFTQILNYALKFVSIRPWVCCEWVLKGCNGTCTTIHANAWLQVAQEHAHNMTNTDVLRTITPLPSSFSSHGCRVFTVSWHSL